MKICFLNTKCLKRNEFVCYPERFIELKFQFLYFSLNSSQQFENFLQTIDDPNDGSTTDGSISILSETEYQTDSKNDHSDQFGDTNELDEFTTPEPTQMWLRCNPTNMAVCTKQSLSPRSVYGDGAEEITLPAQNLIEDLHDYLERLNNFFVSTYLGQVLLLFVTIISLSSFAFIYVRYTNMRSEVKDLQQKIYEMQMEKYQVIGKLATCEFLKDTETNAIPNDLEKEVKGVEAIEATETTKATEAIETTEAPEETTPEPEPVKSTTAWYDDYVYDFIEMDPVFTSFSRFENEMEEHRMIVERVDPTETITSPTIEQTETVEAASNESSVEVTESEEKTLIPSVIDHKGNVVWTGDDEPILERNDPDPSSDMWFIKECDGDDSLFSSYTKEFCDKQKKARNERLGISPTPISCKLSEVDISMGPIHAEEFLKKGKCEFTEAAAKYLRKRYHVYKDEQLRKMLAETAPPNQKYRQEDIEMRRKLSAKFNKNDNDDDDDDGSSEERFKKKNRHDKKYNKDSDNAKENKKKFERKESRKSKEDNGNKWKRDGITNQNHRYDD